MTSVAIMLASLPILLAASAVFSGSETALFSLSAQQRARFARGDGVIESTITTLLAETRSLLITLLLGNMTINVLYFAITSMLLIRLGQVETAPVWLPVLVSVAPLITIIFFGEVMPKLIAARIPERWSRLIALPMFIFHRLITPIRVFCSAAIVTPLSRLIAPVAAPPLSADELGELLNLSQRQGVINADEQQVLQQVLELSDMRVRDLMVPRVDIEAFDLDDDPAALLNLIRVTRLRHIPVYRTDLDHIEGVVLSREALLNPPQSREQIARLIRGATFVPEQQSANRLLQELRQHDTALAIVVDEYGGTAGLITIEDVVEHVIGDLAGSYEPGGDPEVIRLSPHAWRASADLSVRDWPELFARRGAKLPAGASTLGGLIMATLGRVPEQGERLVLGGLAVTVEEIEGRRIRTVTITLAESAETTQ